MLRNIALAALLAWAAHAQVVAPSDLKFEVASLKPATGLGSCYSPDPGRFTCKATLNMLISTAFQLKPYQSATLTGADSSQGPTFDVIATVPAAIAQSGVPREELQKKTMAMLRNLLIERFQLAYHYDKKEINAFSLTVDKAGFNPKVDPTSGPRGAPQGYVQRAGTVMTRWHAPAENWMDISKASMETITSRLSSAVLKAPVTDDTGLKDVYSLTLHFETFNYTPPATAPEAVPVPLPTIFQALSAQGLKLVPKKVMADLFVVDHALTTPTEN